jgi:hypothetical protein
MDTYSVENDDNNILQDYFERISEEEDNNISEDQDPLKDNTNFFYKLSDCTLPILPIQTPSTNVTLLNPCDSPTFSQISPSVFPSNFSKSNFTKDSSSLQILPNYSQTENNIKNKKEFISKTMLFHSSKKKIDYDICQCRECIELVYYIIIFTVIVIIIYYFFCFIKQKPGEYNYCSIKCQV